MIEMKYDESANRLKLPKNIRQVGKPGDKVKIYVEDYVITYMNQIAGEAPDKQHLAVLLGHPDSREDKDVLFIDGALEARDVVVQEDTVVFTSEIWTAIYDEIGQYFHDAKIVGWFLTRPGKSLGITDKIRKIHTDNFPGETKALYIADPVDHEEAFYIYRDGDLVRQEGYYIYYERNEDMQNYLVDHRENNRSEESGNTEFMKKREEILGRSQDRKKGKGSFGKKDWLLGLKRAGSLVVTFGILFALIFGFSQLNSSGTGTEGVSENGEIPVNVDAGTIISSADKVGGEDVVQADKNETRTDTLSENYGEEDSAVFEAGADETVVVSENNVNGENLPGEDENDETAAPVGEAAAENQEDVAVQNIIRQYEVKAGDTLAGISMRFYNSYNYIEMIQEMNQIEDADKIYPGMKLNLP